MKIHVLAGDALAESFKQTNIEGEIIVCRECLVEGAVQAANLEDFWQARAAFIAESNGGNEPDYLQNVAGEFEKLQTAATTKEEVNLWFEYELFCQVNLWFCLSLLRVSTAKIFRVAPVVRQSSEIWKGFGQLDSAALEKCFTERVEFSESDILLGANLWHAYQAADHERLDELSETGSPCFPHLREVCRAAIEQDSRPRKVIEGIIANGKTELSEVFPEFSNQAGVYGFGDLQVKRIMAAINPN